MQTTTRLRWPTTPRAPGKQHFRANVERDAPAVQDLRPLKHTNADDGARGGHVRIIKATRRKYDALKAIGCAPTVVGSSAGPWSVARTGIVGDSPNGVARKPNSEPQVPEAFPRPGSPAPGVFRGGPGRYAGTACQPAGETWIEKLFGIWRIPNVQSSLRMLSITCGMYVGTSTTSGGPGRPCREVSPGSSYSYSRARCSSLDLVASLEQYWNNNRTTTCWG